MGPIMYVKIRPLSVKSRIIGGNGGSSSGDTTNTSVRELTMSADDQQPILLDASLLCGKVAVLSQVLSFSPSNSIHSVVERNLLYQYTIIAEVVS